jgi:hypothetical protein
MTGEVVRILFVSAPLAGHVLPLVPLAIACRDAGHDVLVAAGGGVPAGGLPTHDLAPRFHFGRTAGRIMLRHPLLARRELAGRGGLDVVGLLFGAVNTQLVGPAVALAERWRPDLVVHEPLAVAGAVAAARLGVPAVLHENNLFPGPELVRAVADSPAMRRYPVGTPAAVVSTAPASLVGPRTGWPMRAVPWSGGGHVPDWLLREAERPRILVSRSTLDGPGGADPTAAVAAAAADVDAEIVLIRPSAAATRRTPAPNVRTVGPVPLDRILPYAAATVHHSGAGSVLGALAAGVPQLAVAGPGDRRHNADLVARRGAGLAAQARDVDPATLRRLLTDDGLRAAAGAVRGEMAAMPAPADLVDRLTKLT